MQFLSKNKAGTNHPTGVPSMRAFTVLQQQHLLLLLLQQYNYTYNYYNYKLKLLKHHQHQLLLQHAGQRKHGICNVENCATTNEQRQNPPIKDARVSFLQNQA